MKSKSGALQRRNHPDADDRLSDVRRADIFNAGSDVKRAVDECEYEEFRDWNRTVIEALRIR